MPLHLLLTIGLCASPLLAWIPVWLLDMDRGPENGYVHTQENEPGTDDDEGVALAARPAA